MSQSRRQFEPYHTPRKRERRRGRMEWQCRVYNTHRQAFVDTCLFPLKDDRARDPSLATKRLRGAWERVSSGKLPRLTDAILRANEIYEEWKRSPGDGLSLHELAEIEKKHPGRGRRRQPSTMVEIGRTLDRFVEFMTEHFPRVDKPELVRGAHIEDYLSWRMDSEVRTYDRRESRSVPTPGRKVSISTARNELAYIKRMFELAVEREDIERNPCRRIKLSQPPTEADEREALREYCLSVDDLEKILEACRCSERHVVQGELDGDPIEVTEENRPPDYLYPLVFTKVMTGCRIGELIETLQRMPNKTYAVRPGLTWDRVNYEEHSIVVYGKSRSRVVPLEQSVQDTLRCLEEGQKRNRTYQSDGAVFLSSKGTPLRDPRTAFQTACRKAGIQRKVRFHDLRHTALTRLAKLRLAPATIQRVAGHSTQQMTARYINIDNEHMIDSVRRLPEDSS